MSAPKRIQLRRTKGWRKPEGAIKVDRTTKWGNPFVIHSHDGCGDLLEDCTLHEEQMPVDDAESAVRGLRHVLMFPTTADPWFPSVDDIRYELAGHDLACWCPLDQPCHADVLLELANPS
ncbi:MAG: DUF4326 domain-containing protein [Aquihabitans sp.]